MKNTALLRRRILTRKASIGVLGLGFEGLSLACAAADAGFVVSGFDPDRDRMSGIGAEPPTATGVPEDSFRSARESGRLILAEDAGQVAGSDIVLISVPTPVEDHAPDLSHIEDACRLVAGGLRSGSLVVLESTTYPGITDQFVRPLLEAPGLRAGVDFLLAYSPHRLDPRIDGFTLPSVPKVVGGVSPDATGMATLFYGQIVDKVVAVSSCRTAEMVKLLENAFRHVNVALVNELAMHCHEVGIDVWEVLEAAETKPFGFLSFEPGQGIGEGIPVESTRSPSQAWEDGCRAYRVLEQAQDVNAQMPAYVAGRIGDALNETGMAVSRANVLVIGVTDRQRGTDARESSAIKVMGQLMRRGARVTFHDPYVQSVIVGGVLLTRSQLTQSAIARSDCVAILTRHPAYDLDWIAGHARLVFDAQNAFGQDHRPNVVRL